MRQFIWVLVACWVSAQASASTRDIFTNSTKTRRIANSGETAQAIGIGSGCAGFLLGPNIGMSAAHCMAAGDEVRSAVALKDDLPPDGKIGKTLEFGSQQGFDLWIFEVVWGQAPYPKGIKIIQHVQTSPSQVRVGDNNSADAIYTLGFPSDISHGKLVLSWGYGKTDGSDKSGKILNNISLINGNSGGMVLRLKDKLLVSLVSGGPHNHGVEGWKDNDWNDPQHWNWGPAIWKWYAQSKVLQTLYPKGLSRYYNPKWDFETLSLGFGDFVEDLMD